jgi:hypothetical protein
MWAALAKNSRLLCYNWALARFGICGETYNGVASVEPENVFLKAMELLSLSCKII